ncbi:MAG: hypothetical protein LJE94_03785 [Deltaproteobacteria bacterium]|nr:hypothetical protein [Deltaproteobacteria bacterium]
MSETVKQIKQVCKCEKCGSEAEMVVTCTLPETDTADAPRTASQNSAQSGRKQRVKGIGTCSSCGNEADMWVDL